MYLDSDMDQWIQIATVHGGIRDCGDIDFPGLYIRLDDPDVFNFVQSIINPNIQGLFHFLIISLLTAACCPKNSFYTPTLKYKQSFVLLSTYSSFFTNPLIRSFSA